MKQTIWVNVTSIFYSFEESEFLKIKMKSTIRNTPSWYWVQLQNKNEDNYYQNIIILRIIPVRKTACIYV